MSNIIPFGKYKGRTIEEVLIDDPSYLQWCADQDWFRTRFNVLYQVIINRGAEPEETPEHNALQVQFLDDDFCVRVARQIAPDDDRQAQPSLETARQKNLTLIIRALERAQRSLQSSQRMLAQSVLFDRKDWEGQRKYDTERIAYLQNLQADFSSSVEKIAFKVWRREFERNGIDVAFETTAYSRSYVEPAQGLTDGNGGYWQSMSVRIGGSLRVEIKPTVGDNYPAVLRQMRANRSNVLLIDKYTGLGATSEQFVETFAPADIKVVFLADVEALVHAFTDTTCPQP